jgi:hypothetical protein
MRIVALLAFVGATAVRGVRVPRLLRAGSPTDHNLNLTSERPRHPRRDGTPVEQRASSVRHEPASRRREQTASSGYSLSMPDIHIIPDGDRWNVKEEDGDVVSTHDTQAEAEQAGKAYARGKGGGEVFTHRDEGEFSRIRKGDAV